METRISATELARTLGDVLARIRYRREEFVVERNGVPVARVVPIQSARLGTLAELLTIWTSHEPDSDLADVLERAGAADRPPENPWDS